MIFSKTELKFVERQAFASFNMASSRSEEKCLPQSFPTPNGVTVLDVPVIYGDLCYLFLLADVICHCWHTLKLAKAEVSETTDFKFCTLRKSCQPT